MKMHLFIVISLTLLLHGCMTERMQPVAEYAFVPNQSFFLVKKTGYDEHGRPLFPPPLRERPGKAGELFTIVHAVNKRPVKSYDILIVEERKADMGRPFAVIYEWTGKGFEGGIALSESIMPNGFIGSGSDAAVYLAFKAAPVLIGGITGFVVGIISSVPETMSELPRVIVDAREKVVGYTVYEYDERGRIKFIKLYPPVENNAELVKTEFFYEGMNEAPYRTEITSLIEKKVRMIQ